MTGAFTTVPANQASWEPNKDITWGELHVGSHWVFADAGFTEVAHPTLRRLVMRIDLQRGPSP